MPSREASAVAHLSLVEGSDDPSSLPPDTPLRGEPDWRSLFERQLARAATERARADASEARVQELLSDIRRLRTALRKAEAGKGARVPPPRDTRRRHKARESSQDQRDTIKSLQKQIRHLNRDIARLSRDLEEAESHKQAIRRLDGENTELRARLRELRDQSDTIDWLWGQVSNLRNDLDESAAEKRWLKIQLADRPLLPEAFKKLCARQKTIQSLSKENARLRTTVAALQATLANYRASRAVLSKALFGSRSEQQEKPRSERPRGQQRGAPGHSRTQRPGLEERTEVRNPPEPARVCSCCGKPYVANGANSLSIIEIDVQAHTRSIVRPRWRRSCTCESSPPEVSAPPPARLFPRTPYGTSVWARVVFERYACLRPLNRVSAWLSDHGLPISPGTLADSAKRFVPLFEPVTEAILAHQNKALVRHGDETAWRIQSLREMDRSSRAWLWTSVSQDTVYFHIDPSRSTEVAMALFGGVTGTVVLVCDRFSTYKSLARELGGKVILQWCWAHQRRSFIDCAAGHVRLTRWCQGWIERIAAIYRLNDARLEHYDPALEQQTAEFDVAQGTLKKAVDDLFADAEAELAGLSAKAFRARPLRSLLNHREGLNVFVDHPHVPMDNNAAERALRSAVIGRQLSFGSDSETGTRFTAMMYSVAGTLALNRIDVRRWLEEWLAACAKNGGNPPNDLEPWLPWSMSEDRRRALAAPG